MRILLNSAKTSKISEQTNKFFVLLTVEIHHEIVLQLQIELIWEIIFKLKNLSELKESENKARDAFEMIYFELLATITEYFTRKC